MGVGVQLRAGAKGGEGLDKVWCRGADAGSCASMAAGEAHADVLCRLAKRLTCIVAHWC